MEVEREYMPVSISVLRSAAATTTAAASVASTAAITTPQNQHPQNPLPTCRQN